MGRYRQFVNRFSASDVWLEAVIAASRTLVSVRQLADVRQPRQFEIALRRLAGDSILTDSS
jgi:hypothetical protein